MIYALSISHRNGIKNTNRMDTYGNVIQKQTSIIDCKHSMVAIDLDLELDSLDVLIQSYKWYKKLFLGLCKLYWLLTNFIHVMYDSAVCK